MEWRVDGSRHKLDRPRSSCRSLPFQQARLREQGLWGTLTMLFLFAGTAMASLETLRAASGSLGSVSSASMEKNSMETPFLAVWKQRHGKNVTMQELIKSKLLRPARSPSRSKSARRKSRRIGDGPCRLYSRYINIKDLGFGYVTEEVVNFKYCIGGCESTVTNYDHVLNFIVGQGVIVPNHKPFISERCCRPTQFEDFGFLDAYSVWHVVANGSAAQCDCVG